MKKCMLVSFFVACFLMAGTAVSAKIEWEIIRDIELSAKPIDLALASDGTTAYILTEKNITIYSLQNNRIVDTLPLSTTFSSISVSPRADMLLLTSARDNAVSMISIAEVFDIPIGTSPVIGSRDARVTLTMFFDFQCPHCSRVFPVVEQLLERYPQDLNVVIKHFTLRSHQFAPQAAIASLAADRQGKHLELTREMLNNFRTLSEASLQEHARTVGLDLEKFEQDRKDNAFQRQLQLDRRLAREVGVRGVPQLFINGRGVTNRSLAGMSQMIEQELKKKD